MNDQDLNERLFELSKMVGREASMDSFTEGYESLLVEVKGESNHLRRYQQAQRLRKLLAHQSQYLMKEWLREHKKNGLVYGAEGKC